MADLKVNLCGIELDNPIIPASGTFGYGYEFTDYYDINMLGTFSFKGTTRDPRFGNPTPRIAECYAGMINAVGLQNPGVERVLCEELPKMKEVFHKKVMANVSGFSVEDYAYTCEKLNDCEEIGWFEVNVSCPNVHGGGMSFGTSPEAAAEVTRAVKKVTTKPVLVKLSPNVTDIASIAKAVEAEGADAVSLTNTFLGMAIDVEKQAPILSTITGGLSGPCIRPIAVRMVWQVAKAVQIPVIGLGGIMNGRDALEFMLAGATAVEVGTANFINPAVTVEIVDYINDYCQRHGIDDINTIIGKI
jgi:dihydroorotate dehydrogenase (NAD+) catalytic subunit